MLISKLWGIAYIDIFKKYLSVSLLPYHILDKVETSIFLNTTYNDFKQILH